MNQKMKRQSYFRVLFLLSVFVMFGEISAQAVEILTNADVVSMAQSNLGEDLIVAKIKESKSAFDVSVIGLVNLKKSGVSVEIIRAMMEKSRALREKSNADSTAAFSDSSPVIESVPHKDSDE